MIIPTTCQNSKGPGRSVTNFAGCTLPAVIFDFSLWNLPGQFLPLVSRILQFFTGPHEPCGIFDDDEELKLLDLALGDNDAIAAASAAHKRRMAAAAAAIFPQEGGQGPGGKKEKVKEFSWGARASPHGDAVSAALSPQLAVVLQAAQERRFTSSFMVEERTAQYSGVRFQ